VLDFSHSQQGKIVLENVDVGKHKLLGRRDHLSIDADTAGFDQSLSMLTVWNGLYKCRFTGGAEHTKGATSLVSTNSYQTLRNPEWLKYVVLSR